MARFRVINLGQGTKTLYGIERTDDEGTCMLLRDRFKTKAEAETEALRQNLLAADRNR
jgi:hypothetical protein